MTKMDMPQFYDLIKIVSKIGAILGIIAGVVVLYAGLKTMYSYSFLSGLSVVGIGFVYIIAAFIYLGFVFSFLAMVKAQIDTRNMMQRLLEKLENSEKPETKDSILQ